MYICIQANGGDALTLDLRLEAATAMNEDGIAIVPVEAIGYRANKKHDYDTFAVKFG